MNLEETIYKRQSIRAYDETPLDEDTLAKIRDFIENTKVLNPNIDWSYDIVGPEFINTMMRWKAPHYLILFSKENENYLENIGFIFQQVDLFLQSNGIGTCWIGMASPKNYKSKDGHKFIIAISFGRSLNPIYRNRDGFRRNSLSKIVDIEDERLIPAQFAPSSTNSQPWYFTHNDDGSYNVYRVNRGILRNKFMGKWNKVDIGIALAHLYVSNEETFEFYITESPKELKNYFYSGTFRI